MDPTISPPLYETLTQAMQELPDGKPPWHELFNSLSCIGREVSLSTESTREELSGRIRQLCTAHDVTAERMLYEAARKCQIPALRLFAASNISCNSTFFGETPLTHAIKKGRESIALALIEFDQSNLDCINRDFKTALMLSVQAHNLTLVRKLVEAGASLDLMDAHGDDVFSLAVRIRDENILSYFVSNQTPDSSRALELLEDVDAKGQSSFCRAAIEGDIEEMRFLMQWGVDINRIDSQGRSILLLSLLKRRPLATLFLLQNPKIGDSINRPDRVGNTPLLFAMDRGYVEIARNLLQRARIRDSINLSNDQGGTPLIHAISEGCTELVLDLLQRRDIGSSVNLQNKYGVTPLILAIGRGLKEVTRNLLKRSDIGDSINLRDRDGNTALSLAEANREISTARTIRKIQKKRLSIS